MSSPENTNYVRSDKFKLVFKNIPIAEYFTTKINLPGVIQSAIEVPNPVNRAYFGNTKLQYDNFTISFRVDEDLKNYLELFDWISGITSPIDSKQFADLISGIGKQKVLNQKESYSNIYSDATLISLTNSSNKNISVTFADMMPISLSGLDFDAETNSILNATASFVFTYFKFNVR